MANDTTQADLRRVRVLDIIAKQPDKSVKEAMMEVGYSESYATNSNVLLNSPSFQDKLRAVIGDEAILNTLKTLFNRRTYQTKQFDMDVHDEEILLHLERIGAEFPSIKVKTIIDKKREVKRKNFRWVEYEKEVKEVGFYIPMEETINRVLDKIFKLRGEYVPDQINGSVTIGKLLVNIFSNEERRPIQRSTATVIDQERVAPVEPVQDQEQTGSNDSVPVE